MSEQTSESESAATPLLMPKDGTPPVITGPEELGDAIESLKTGSGPFAVDAERASGYKYSARAYLIQIKRTGGGLHLIDPIPFHQQNPFEIHPLFHELNVLIQRDEVILHASTQDLPCLREVGLFPSRLFDTELGGRIAGLPRVGLGALVESLLGISLAKEHSAVDWSKRPLPEDWLTYAALDVELLIELREKISDLLDTQGKLDWASQEFSAILQSPPPSPRKEPWRRSSGIHKVRRRDQLAIIKSIWHERDTLAREADVAPSKFLSDAALLELAIHLPKTTEEMQKVLRPIGARARWFEHSANWLSAIRAGIAVPESHWPQMRMDSDAMPPVKMWRDKFPAKFAPLSHARAAIATEAERLSIPPENLISPDLVRRLCWNPPEGATRSYQLNAVVDILIRLGARKWQANIVGPHIAAALLEHKPLVVVSEEIIETDEP
jgi:ribonuclease D